MRLCPICESDRSDLLYTTPTGQTIQCCTDCGMVFASNTPVVDYTTNSTYSCAATCTYKEGRYERIVQNCLQSGVTRNKSVIDVGCAIGGLMQAFISVGFQVVHGLSISIEEVRECTRRGLTAMHRDVSDIGILSPYDLVTISHVLEHIPEPVTFLRALCRWVKPNGKVYVEVPNARYYADYFTGICQGFNGEHINHFDDDHLCDALVRSGFVIDTVDHYITDGYPCVWVMASRKETGNSLRTNIESYTKLLDAQLAHIRQHLHTQLEGTERIAIWGAGQTAHLVIANDLDKCFIEAVTDTNHAYWGQRIHKCMVVAPHLFKPRKSVPIVICSQLSQAAITESIRKLGLPNRIITLGEK